MTGCVIDLCLCVYVILWYRKYFNINCKNHRLFHFWIPNQNHQLNSPYSHCTISFVFAFAFKFTSLHYQFNGGYYISFFFCYFIYCGFPLLESSAFAFHFPSVIYRSNIMLRCYYVFSFDVSHQWNRFGHSHFITIPLYIRNQRKRKKSIHFYFFLLFIIQIWFIALFLFFSFVVLQFKWLSPKTTVSWLMSQFDRSLSLSLFPWVNGKLLMWWKSINK